MTTFMMKNKPREYDLACPLQRTQALGTHKCEGLLPSGYVMDTTACDITEV